MKPKFENMIDLVVRSLSGEARNFYEREFAFFNEVTSISRKLQPFIKKSKPEKKVSPAHILSQSIVRANGHFSGQD